MPYPGGQPDGEDHMDAVEQQEVTWVIDVDEASARDVPWEAKRSVRHDEDDILGENLRDFLEPVLAALVYAVFICELQWLMAV